MAEQHLTQLINNLEAHSQNLIKEYQQLKAEAGTLAGENQALKLQLKECHQQIDGFHNQIKISKIVDNMVEDGQEADATELKQTLNEYIKEIDKCIAHLSDE